MNFKPGDRAKMGTGDGWMVSGAEGEIVSTSANSDLVLVRWDYIPGDYRESGTHCYHNVRYLVHDGSACEINPNYIFKSSRKQLT